MLKHLLFLCSFTALCSPLAQSVADPCIMTKWIEITDIEHNSILFASNSTIDNPVNFLKKLVTEEGLGIYKETTNNAYYDVSWRTLEDIQYLNADEFIQTNELSNCFDSVYIDWIVDLNESGEPKMMTLEDGTETFAYKLLNHPLTMDLVTGIRVREHLMLNEDTGDMVFSVVGFSLVVDLGVKGSQSLFWVGMLELSDFIKDHEKPRWLVALMNKEYTGFQYMQRPCAE